jgi:hypothetical protein
MIGIDIAHCEPICTEIPASPSKPTCDNAPSSAQKTNNWWNGLSHYFKKNQ